VTNVGTTTPADDFNQLLKQGFDVSTGDGLKVLCK
jgi:hypothetical protein